MSLQLIPLEKIDPEDYITPDEFHDLAPRAHSLESKVAKVYDHVFNLAVLLYNGKTGFQALVFKDNEDTYRILENAEVVSAYAVAGYMEVPCVVLQPPNPAIPAYIRKRKAAEQQPVLH
ncbi:hypothetical protein HYX14_03630 [Candidatus Woesearchaeota archaeon]|nr:hypothetical protein [Candidatus Woesearchaeota archaeon]